MWPFAWVASLRGASVNETCPAEPLNATALPWLSATTAAIAGHIAAFIDVEVNIEGSGLAATEATATATAGDGPLPKASAADFSFSGTFLIIFGGLLSSFKPFLLLDLAFVSKLATGTCAVTVAVAVGGPERVRSLPRAGPRI